MLKEEGQSCGMRVEKCYFCSSNIYPGHGITFVRNDCTIFRFCRSKCHKLFKKKRNPRKTLWTKTSRMIRGKELRNDNTLTVELRRNEPLKYERRVWNEAVSAAKELIVLRSKRYCEHIRKTLQPGRAIKRIGDLQKVRNRIHLISAPLASRKKAIEEKTRKEKEEEMETN